MHLLPSTIKKEKIQDGDAEESSSYKKHKEAKDKASSARYNVSCQIARKCRNACGIFTGAVEIPKVDETFAAVSFLSYLSDSSAQVAAIAQ